MCRLGYSAKKVSVRSIQEQGYALCTGFMKESYKYIKEYYIFYK